MIDHDPLSAALLQRRANRPDFAEVITELNRAIATLTTIALGLDVETGKPPGFATRSQS